ncbi:MAG TPA: hypothetical protein VGL58_20455 [Caulobacteraceae bacterium]
MRALIATLLGVTLLAGAGQASADCQGAGVILRIEGRPQDVQIVRPNGVAGARPRVLDVVCEGDVIRPLAPTYVVLGVDGRGNVTVNPSQTYVVPARAGAPSLAGNAYRVISDQVMPDMKRLPWNVVVKGAGNDFGFALPAMIGGGELLRPGARPLLVRMVGGVAPYKVKLTGPQGDLIGQASSNTHSVVLPATQLGVGRYLLAVTDVDGDELEAPLTVVDADPPDYGDVASIPDEEVRAAAAASLLGRQAAATWSFEAEQRLAAAPEHGLDRDKVYELIESYGAE